MDFKAKVIQVLPVQSGPKKDGGTWQNQNIIVETFGQYPKKICLKLPDKFVGQLVVGAVKTFHIDPQSREYNGKWYTDVNVWKIDGVTQEQHSVEQQNEPPATQEEPGTDLPF